MKTFGPFGLGVLKQLESRNSRTIATVSPKIWKIDVEMIQHTMPVEEYVLFKTMRLYI